MTQFTYDVTLADENGATRVVEFSTRWDPAKYGLEEIARAAAATESVAARKRLIPISVSYRVTEQQAA
jgi:hypothetical protein